ncbi:hypothetical protein D9M71_296820 [compost metagenome]
MLAGALSFRLLSGQRRQHLLLLAFATAGVGGLLMATTDNPALVVVAVLINGLGIGLMLPMLITWVMRQVDFTQRGRATGGFTAALFAGEFISPLVVLGLNGGVVAQLPGALTVVAIAQLLLALACLVLVKCFRSRGVGAATTPDHI